MDSQANASRPPRGEFASAGLEAEEAAAAELLPQSAPSGPNPDTPPSRPEERREGERRTERRIATFPPPPRQLLLLLLPPSLLLPPPRPSGRHLQVAYIRRCERIQPGKRARLDETLLQQLKPRLGSLRLSSARLGRPYRRGFSLALALFLSLSPTRSRPPLQSRAMFASRLAASGLLLLALLALTLDGKPAPPELLHKAPAGGATSLQRELLEESSGPAAAVRGGSRSVSRPANGPPTAPKSKGAAAAASRPIPELRPDGKQSRAAWGRMVHPQHQAGGGGGGGGGSRRLKGAPKKGLGSGCFGLKLDRIGSMSGLGC